MTTTDRPQLLRHLRRLRVVAVLFLASQPALATVAYLLPRHRLAQLPPLAVTALMLAWSLWLTLTADRVARSRLLAAKEAFAEHGEEDRLLAAHLRVLLLVLARLEGVALAGLATAVWGAGLHTALWFFVATTLMGLMAWPTEGKVHLLLRRGRELREREGA